MDNETKNMILSLYSLINWCRSVLATGDLAPGSLIRAENSFHELTGKWPRETTKEELNKIHIPEAHRTCKHKLGQRCMRGSGNPGICIEYPCGDPVYEPRKKILI